MTQDLTHRLTRMTGRDPNESHRASTPLELLYDLTFVIGFGVAGSELSHALAADHIAVGLGGFAFAMFAVIWAWTQYTWFASAYDTDDWLCRLMVMVQMLGVVILALGLPDMFASLENGGHLDNRVMVLGYVVMRVPMLAMWLRAAKADPTRKRAPLVYVATIVVSQAIWCWIALSDMSIRATFLVMIVPLLIELGGPVYGERMAVAKRIPWHAHHIAERYGLIVIIALGEGVLGTVTALSAIVGPDGPGWSWDVAVSGFAGVALIFGMWWIYFVLPNGELLDRHRGRALLWAHTHFLVLAALVAVGAGFHVAAYFVERESELSILATVLTVVVPLSAYVLGIFALYTLLTRSIDPFHLVLVAATAAVLVAGVLMASAGVSLEWCLLMLAATPWVTVVGYETIGHRHKAAMLATPAATATAVDPKAERRQRLLSLDLTELAVEFGTDKWGVHRYTPHYQRHLEHLRREKFVLLELGIGGYKRKRRSGASLKMWRWFFPKARIVGLDIEDKSFLDGGRVTTYLGDQTDPGILQRIFDEQGVPLVVIDDGSHIPEHVRASFAIIFPLLPDGAIYCIEDIQTSYWPAWGGAIDPKADGTSMALVKDLVDGLNHEEFLVEGYESTYTDRWIKSVHCYHNLVIIEKGDNVEGSNRDTAAHTFHGSNDAPSAIA